MHPLITWIQLPSSSEALELKFKASESVHPIIVPLYSKSISWFDSDLPHIPTSSILPLNGYQYPFAWFEIPIEIPDKPYLSTLVVNVIGSILLGFFYFVSTQLDLKPNLKDFFVIGYLGSLTTFSALSFEFANMIHQKDFIKAFNYLSLNIALGFISVYLFIRLAKEV